jgi:serine/threonine protein kinase
MGEVYRAHDPKINRDVAIKVLPPDFVSDQDRLKRFEYEAEAAGSLNHPNIVAIYDVDYQDGSPYVVSELLEGDTLRTVIARGPLPTRKAIEYAAQVANGLAAAHTRGIVHRDIKPENLFITKDGRVKVLDFGIAKLIEKKIVNDGNTDLPTKKFHTGAGIAIGTAGYMSPEQVSGKPVDSRTDIFSFGCVFYEMLSGTRAFNGASVVEMLNAILKDEPADLSSLNTQVPTSLERLVRHCLEKDPDLRFQSARDLSFALDTLSGSTASLSVSSPSSVQSRLRKTLPWAIAAIALLFLTGLAVWALRPSSEVGTVRFLVHPPSKGLFQWILGSSSLISPDGQKLVMVITSEGTTRLWIRPLDSPGSQLLGGTEGATNPIWSPDSHSIGFFAEGKLKRIDVNGGSLQTLCPVAGQGPATVGTWGRDGTILFSTGWSIFSVPSSGGDPVVIRAAGAFQESGYNMWPFFLPDGHHFLFMGLGRKTEVLIGSSDSKEIVHLLPVDSRAIYVPQGYLLYVKEGSLLAQPFDANKLSLSGEPMAVADNLLYFQALGFADFSVSDNGVLVYQGGTNLSRLVWYSREGTRLGEIGKPADYSWIQLSPDDQQLAVDIGDPRTGTMDLWLIDLARNTSSHFTSEPDIEIAPVWSPDGKRIVFSANRGAPPFLHSKEINDAGSGKPLDDPSESAQFPWDWVKGPEGEFIIYGDGTVATNNDLLLLPLNGDRKTRPFLRTKFDETEARFSPDGKWVAYVSNESGRREVYVQSFRGGDQKWQVSSAGGYAPRWRGDGKEIYYIDADENIMAVSVKPGPGFASEIAKPLFHIQPASTVYAQYDVTSDGQRFIVNVAAEDQKPSLNVVLNWTNTLKK